MRTGFGARRCRWRLAGLVVTTLLVAACAAKVPPPLPTPLKYPEYVYPAAAANASAADKASVDRGWRYLQNDDLRTAEREFQTALRRSARFAPALTGSAYVDLARSDHSGALTEFDAALKAAPDYVPALVGRGQTLLALDRDAEAIAAFESALAGDPALADVRRRLDVLRFRGMQDLVAQARKAAAAGQLEEARAGFQQALRVSPDTSFLYRELGIVDRRRGDAPSALTALRRAVELDPTDVGALTEIAGLLEKQQDFAGAAAALRSAIDVEPSDELRARVAAVEEKAREAKLPAEFRALPDAAQITRGELAALIGIRLGDLLATAPQRQVVTTDTRRHWADQWIGAVARSAVMEPFPNHTFQPQTRVRRVDLATAVDRLLTLATAARPALRAEWATTAPKIADVGPGHLNYPAVSAAVASGTMPLVEGRFQVARNVSGTEAIDVIDRVRALVALSR